MNKIIDNKEINRRTFLKRTVAGIGAIGMAGLGAAEAMTVNLQQVPKWDHISDVVVIGYGAAGANAAIAAHDAGAKIIILEKMPMAGGNSGVCFGAMAIPNGIPEAIDYYRKLSFGTVDEDMLQGFAEAMVGVYDLLDKLGAQHKPPIKWHSTFPALQKANLSTFRFNPSGKDGFEFLSGLVRKRGIKAMLKTSAQSLVQSCETGDIVGVKAESEGKEIYIKARRGVVLSCGGYENNPEMFGYYNFPGLRDFIFPLGNPGNTGDGLKMASAAGSYLWHTASLQWAGFCAKEPSKKFGVAIGAISPRLAQGHGYIYVNKYGKRFMRETNTVPHTKNTLSILYFDHEHTEYSNVPAYLILDEKTYQMGGPIRREGFGQFGYANVHNIYDWNNDKNMDMEKGWIIKANTIADLAGKVKVDSKGLEETINRFNSYCITGKDLAFNRNSDSMAPIEKPPYYALEMGLALVNTQGGPKHNKYGQVLDPYDKPIPRLYAAGELGSFFGFLYQEGSNYPEAWVFGHIAGKRAASEKPFKE
ncbi:MAG: FAD-binding protein [Proteobacteria bacterium]|nr:FAD-binding protein [Pseudomonadota bacterium]